MKRVIKVLIAVYCMAFMCIFGGIDAFARKHEPDRLRVEFGEVPDGTVFADILVKDRWHDKYAIDFNEENGAFLGVGKDCGLAKYDKNGYTSLLLRHSCAEFQGAALSPDDRWKYVSYQFKISSKNLFRNYRSIKIAYCDNDGNVVGVTEKALTKTFFFTVSGYDIYADGSSLEFRLLEAPLTLIVVSITLGIMLIIILIVTLLVAGRMRKRRNVKIINHIRSGEVDNERKK
ncbi:hypothetical protein [Ruminococcus sp.]|uniref:hypothetical protein n=1 Tax=Ruminococcus sp. TaxID=41978 RepID=UPI002C8A5F56|nr:hypothetical protein [Ruminococcus sp.]HNZ99962.1 hypothetical protein [Ruminococcus sp.]HOH86396.1 hypothetical protein [Ruminococcus sp.]